MPGADEDHQFRHEATEAGQAHAGHSGYYKGNRREGDDVVEVHWTESRKLAGVGPRVDHAANDSEEEAGENSVREHLDDRARQPYLVQGHQDRKSTRLNSSH